MHLSSFIEIFFFPSFLSNPANRQTSVGDNTTSSLEVRDAASVWYLGSCNVAHRLASHLVMWIYLKWSQNKIEHHPHSRMNVIRDEGKNDVIQAKERYQQQSGFSQSPVKEQKNEKVEWRLVFIAVQHNRSRFQGCTLRSSALRTYEYWLDSLLPMSGQFIFCRKIRIIQMKRKKFTCRQSETLGCVIALCRAVCDMLLMKRCRDSRVWWLK